MALPFLMVIFRKKGDAYELEACIRNHYHDAGKRMSEVWERL